MCDEDNFEKESFGSPDGKAIFPSWKFNWMYTYIFPIFEMSSNALVSRMQAIADKISQEGREKI